MSGFQPILSISFAPLPTNTNPSATTGVDMMMLRKPPVRQINFPVRASSAMTSLPNVSRKSVLPTMAKGRR